MKPSITRAGDCTMERSWLRIVPHQKNIYHVSGKLVGANYHECAIELEAGRVPMILVKNVLTYE